MSDITEVSLSLGSNIGRFRHLNAGLDALERTFGHVVSSPVYESAAVGFEGSAFLNSVAIIETTLSLLDVVHRLKMIEDDNGRDRNGAKFSARTLDIDVVTFGDEHGIVQGIELPRAELFKNAFVLKPMTDVWPNKRVPGLDQTYLELWQAYPQDKQPLAEVMFERRLSR